MPALAIHNKIFISACIVIISVNRGEILFGQEIRIKGLNVRGGVISKRKGERERKRGRERMKKG